MKKTWWIGLTAICLTVVLGGTAVIAELAQEKKAGGERTRVTACDYVDADEDGVCDNAAKGRGQRYGNTDGRGSGNGNGARRQCGVNRK